MKMLQTRYSHQIEVIGIHGAKFEQEKKETALDFALQRLGIDYPVFNDAHLELFSSYAIKAWPTTIVIDTKGYIIETFQGELSLDKLTHSIEALIPLHPKKEKEKEKEKRVKNGLKLSFPQKILCSSTFLAIANTAADTVILSSYEGKIIGCIEGITEPLGMTYAKDILYIASGHDNAIYSYELQSKKLKRVLENLSTPYDVVFFQNQLVVAMAGSHQLIAFNDKKERLWHVGNRFEALRDGIGETAQLAQPSGMDVDAEGIYFVDAESSSLRYCENKTVHTFVGEGLFSFGDRNEGEVLLQHPQDVVYGKIGDGCGGGRIFIVDTFNSKLKVFNPEDGAMMTLLDSLNEPCGLDKIGCDIYIADTNSSQIIRFNLSQMQAYPFDLYE